MVDVQNLSDDDLRQMLMQHGINVGPVVATTRKVYENKLARLLSEGNAAPAVNGHQSPISSNNSAKNQDYDPDDNLEGEEGIRFVDGGFGDTYPKSSIHNNFKRDLTSTPFATNTRSDRLFDYQAQEGNLEESQGVYRRSGVSPRTASPFDPYVANNQQKKQAATSEEWIPLWAKLIIGLLMIIFLYMLFNRLSDYSETEDPRLPA